MSRSKKRIGIVGGGINGVVTAWQLALDGHEVDLFERDTLMSATSRSSSKLLHGGLRYLENGEFGLVQEALKERDEWLKRAPDLTRSLRLLLPIYSNAKRSAWKVRIGLGLYDLLAGSSTLPKSRKLSKAEVLEREPSLKPEGLRGGFLFSDGQMDDEALGLWVADQARRQGVSFHERTEIQALDPTGSVFISNGEARQFDHVFNIAGPWAEQLLNKSNIESPYTLDLVRGSHLILERKCQQPCLLEFPDENRVFFVLPWHGKTLVGTTEVRQSLSDPIHCSDDERQYLLRAFQHYFPQESVEVVETFAGVRPLIYGAKDPGKATREYAIFSNQKLTTVFGGKWTTATALAKKLVKTLH